MSPLLLHSNTNRYNINVLLCTYTVMFRILTCCNHILSAAEGFGDRRQHARIQEFLSVLFDPQLILQFTEGVQWFYCCEKYTYTLPRIQRPPIIFQGVSNFIQGGGPNAYFYRNPYTYLLFSRGGGVYGPPIPSGSAHGQCHHNGTIFITVPLLTMITRHWFVRINDR